MSITEAKGVDLGVGKVESGLIFFDKFCHWRLGGFSNIDVGFFLEFLTEAHLFPLIH